VCDDGQNVISIKILFCELELVQSCRDPPFRVPALFPSQGTDDVL
jgi:hypothetical protein